MLVFSREVSLNITNQASRRYVYILFHIRKCLLVSKDFGKFVLKPLDA